LQFCTLCCTVWGVRDVGKRTGLIRRGKGYTLRVVVPKDLWTKFALIWDRENPGRRKRRSGEEVRQLWITLDETDRRKAVETANLKQVWLDGLFSEARDDRHTTVGVSLSATDPSREAIHRIVQCYFHQLERSHQPVPLDISEREYIVQSTCEFRFASSRQSSDRCRQTSGHRLGGISFNVHGCASGRGTVGLYREAPEGQNRRGWAVAHIPVSEQSQCDHQHRHIAEGRLLLN
jgi:hypothetical protein